jgi:hypothetical protein
VNPITGQLEIRTGAVDNCRANAEYMPEMARQVSPNLHLESRAPTPSNAPTQTMASARDAVGDVSELAGPVIRALAGAG